MFGMFNDPFFEGHRQQMQQFDAMFRDPFGSMGGGSMMALPGAGGIDRRDHHRRQQQQGQNMTVAERGAFMDPFSHFDSMFSNMRNMMSEMHRSFEAPGGMANPNGHTFQQSSVMTFSNTGNGPPKIYQASSSTRSGPGGVKETRRTVRDSHRGLEKMSVGHHINDRSHVIERSRENGQMHENQEYINLDEEEVQSFDREYQDKWGRSAMRGLDGRRRAERDRHGPIGGRPRQLALPEAKSHRPRKSHRE